MQRSVSLSTGDRSLVDAWYTQKEQRSLFRHVFPCSEGHLIEGDRISPAQLQSELKSANVKLIGAFCGDDLVGSVVVTRKSPLLASVGMLNVEPQLQNFGVGKKLMDAAESVFEVDTLELVVLAKVCLVLCWTKLSSFAFSFSSEQN